METSSCKTFWFKHKASQFVTYFFISDSFHLYTWFQSWSTSVSLEWSRWLPVRSQGRGYHPTSDLTVGSSEVSHTTCQVRFCVRSNYRSSQTVSSQNSGQVRIQVKLDDRSSHIDRLSQMTGQVRLCVRSNYRSSQNIGQVRRQVKSDDRSSQTTGQVWIQIKSYTRSNQSLELSQTIEVRSRVESKFESSHTHGQVRLSVNSALLQLTACGILNI